MPYTEIVIARIKQDEGGGNGFPEAWRKAAQILARQKGLKTGYSGFAVEEDGEQVKGDNRFILLPVWEHKTNCDNFLKTEDLGRFRAGIMPFTAEASKPQIYETNNSPVDSAEAPLTEIVRTRVSKTEDRRAAAEAWNTLSPAVKSRSDAPVSLTHGHLLNQDEDLYIGVLGYDTKTVPKDSDVDKCIAQLRQLGETTVIFAEFYPMNTDMTGKS